MTTQQPDARYAQKQQETAGDAASSTIQSSPPSWIHLTDKKALSRLLYANPVCFLTCWCDGDGGGAGVVDDDDDDGRRAGGDMRPAAAARGAVTVDGEGGAARPNTTASPCGGNSIGEGGVRVGRRTKNVMTLSWLTATNNRGCFVFSVNRRRHTASAILGATASGRRFEFALSVPVAGMEDLVLSVGRASGMWGSKFPGDYPPCDTVKEDDARGIGGGGEEGAAAPDGPTVDDPPLGQQEEIPPARRAEGKRSKRKQRRAKGTGEGGVQFPFRRGVPGLHAVPLGHQYQLCPSSSPSSPSDDQSLPPGDGGVGIGSGEELFAIDGTVAHLHCRTLAVMEDAVDGDHLLVTAEILCAYVDPSYWDGTRRRFLPLRRHADDAMGQRSPSPPPPPPYLTFFGSQTLGHVCEGGAIDGNRGDRNADEASS